MQVDEHSSASARQQLRQLLLATRAQLTETERERAAVAVSEHLHTLPEFSAATRIGSYISVKAELPTEHLNLHLSHEKQLAVPILHPVITNHLLFLRAHAHTHWITNRYGIPEPQLRLPDVVPLTQLDILLVPLVGFDHHGNRMGMGGGFYDRTLAGYHQHSGARPLVIGLAFDCQVLESLPSQAWDVPLPMVISPAKIWDFR